MDVAVERERASSAREVLVRLYSSLRRLAQRHCFSHADLDDIVQESAVRVWRHCGVSLEDRAPHFAWLAAVVHNAAVDFNRKTYKTRNAIAGSFNGPADRRPSEYDERLQQVPAPDNVEVEVERREIQYRVTAMLEELKPEYRQALLMVAEGYSYQDVAAMQEVPLGTARSRIFYARRPARDLFPEYQ